MSLAGTLFTNVSDKAVDAAPGILGTVAETIAPTATDAAAETATQAATQVAAELLTQGATTAAGTVATEAERKMTETAAQTAAAVAPDYFAQFTGFFTDTAPSYAKAGWDAVSPHLPELRNNLIVNNPVITGITIGVGAIGVGLFFAHRHGALPDRHTPSRLKERWNHRHDGKHKEQGIGQQHVSTTSSNPVDSTGTAEKLSDSGETIVKDEKGEEKKESRARTPSPSRQ